ncbi:carboxylesterase/lipase family protein [Shewanella fodinae]|uniref:carboxylesterase/lipase family protein n=1 Tax=Shewanella fodinae TaxID=552357 RepID=UPI001679C26C|nr:carboxylesterase family protein [Shewanella fodinae]MCL2908360.1 carboxylesterase family protein [Shewanella fodinae]
MKLLKICLALGCLLSSPFVSAQSAPIVQIQSGRIAGLHQQDVDIFLGIPYAKPPLGELRWQRPLTAPAWRGIRQATTFGPSCMQAPLPNDAAPLPDNYSEDCLTLNIWRPSQLKGPTPVMVWIHGGGFVNGGSASPVYDGAAFARAGVIFVSFNYRLGRLGFFAHPAMDGNMFVGNFGLTDQIKALRWVQDNIIQFGGDPRNVTLFGESAGGYSINALLSSRFGRDLFQKAIIQSGNGRHSLAGEQSWQQAKTIGMAFAAAHGIGGTDKMALQALRALPATEITGDLNLWTMAKNHQTYSGPMTDGQVVEKEPQVAYQRGDFARVPLLVGANSADLGFVTTPPVNREAVLAQFGADSSAAAMAYSGITDKNALAYQIAMQKLMLEPARFVARTFAAHNTPVWQYRFGYVAKRQQHNGAGATHASEIPFIFNTLPAVYGDKVTTEDQQVANMMQQYWVNFAKTGNPNGTSLPEWQQYQPTTDRLLWIAPQGISATQSLTDPQQAQLDLVEKLQQ